MDTDCADKIIIIDPLKSDSSAILKKILDKKPIEEPSEAFCMNISRDILQAVED